MHHLPKLVLPLFVVLFFLVSPSLVAADTVESPTILDESGRLIDFERDIAPIFAGHCLECHGPDDAKNDFRVDEADILLDYLEPEDALGSSLFVDYMTSDDEDMMMPPPSHGGPLSTSELSLIRTWIDEGANWPSGAVVGATEVAIVPEVVAAAAPKSFLGRVWSFQGYLHPATVHFPIALLLVGALFVVLGIKWPAVGTQIPTMCLILGGASAIVATLMGWSFASEQGYGGWSKIDFDSELFWHRWSGVAVASGSAILMIVAAIGFWKDSGKLMGAWKLGLVVLAAMVGFVGHQGGELNYGKDFYPKAIGILLGQDSEAVSPVAVIEEPIDN
ncbi:Planctomycete cytochrome C [Novipirellula aureliae]|uniref:Planctomycete cytochrome C n=1 Tax=Novipirellula aureliae TaxID=2527966 RepID=A0A5C6EBB0_9BACT|nr:c-type cytochrome domain-containing protein [Novipirellula aureliae]TWU45041.1 Planctomycete cytochrome C [Novipirellula aureliae]